MTFRQSNKSKLSNIDKFGIGTGLIGLVADLISLAGLFKVSSNSQDEPTYIWFLVLGSTIYTVAGINFFARRYFFKKIANEIEIASEQERRRLEAGTFAVTALISYPSLIFYFMFAFLAASDFENSYLYPSIFRGLVAGGFIAWLVSNISHRLVRSIYEAHDPLYALKFTTSSSRIGRNSN
ncbi:MAG TPA: hypothetical protein IGS53_18650 [Leptolyngbyaceae cyanobacterium M33_DOE_097]|uniref:Uncharacterized protein n=1 Tax=Oscillatoriales cyanobacterium SpSt-418 TaxID=2282169 RepID=A0A7C3KJF5_9CYAN|nr:hypothetical protein [Leptolyngbyaceae cyanobacterium M33_DOE_097]